MLQLVCNSETGTLDDAFWVAAWYFWAAAPSWLTCVAQITDVKYVQYLEAKEHNPHAITFTPIGWGRLEN